MLHRPHDQLFPETKYPVGHLLTAVWGKSDESLEPTRFSLLYVFESPRVAANTYFRVSTEVMNEQFYIYLLPLYTSPWGDARGPDASGWTQSLNYWLSMLCSHTVHPTALMQWPLWMCCKHSPERAAQPPSAHWTHWMLTHSHKSLFTTLLHFIYEVITEWHNETGWFIFFKLVDLLTSITHKQITLKSNGIKEQAQLHGVFITFTFKATLCFLIIDQMVKTKLLFEHLHTILHNWYTVLGIATFFPPNDYILHNCAQSFNVSMQNNHQTELGVALSWKPLLPKS